MSDNQPTEGENLLKDILDIVDKLTKPWEETFGPAVTGERYVTVKHESLLAMLRENIVAGIGGDGSSLGSQRVPLNQSAFELYDAIEGEVSEAFVRLTGKPAYPLPEETLRQWFVAFSLAQSRAQVTEFGERGALKMVRGWVARITAMFNPPEERYLPEEVKEMMPTTNGPVPVKMTKPKACPLCGERYKVNADGDQTYALVMQWMTEQPDSLRGLCKSCDVVWEGENALWDLRVALDKADAAKLSDTPLLA